MLLEKEGLVQIPPRRRPRVALLAMEEVREIYQARAALFDLIATAVARNASTGDIATLASDFPKWSVVPRRGSQCVCLGQCRFLRPQHATCKQPHCQNVFSIHSCRATLRLRRLSLSQPDRMQASLDENARLLKAYENRDARLAAAPSSAPIT